MERYTRRVSGLGAVAAFFASAALSAGCIGVCKGYCDGFQPEVAQGSYPVEIFEETAADHYASSLSEVEVTDEQVVLRYDDLDGDPQEVVWDIVRVESP